MNRHLSRIIAMQTLYEWDFRQNGDPMNIMERHLERVGDDADREFVSQLINGALEHIGDIDGSITKAAPEWPLEQIAVVDKTILRLAIFELLYLQDVPPKVAINEAVELGKAFGGENSSKFINGVLGTLYRQSDRYQIEDEELEETATDSEAPSDDLGENS